MPDLSTQERIALVNLLNGLMPPEFETLRFSINAPYSLLPSSFSSPGERTAALLKWVEGSTGSNLLKFLKDFDLVFPGVLEQHLPGITGKIAASQQFSTSLDRKPKPEVHADRGCWDETGL